MGCTNAFGLFLQITMEASSPERQKISSDPELETLSNEKKIKIDDQQSEKIIRVWNKLISDAGKHC